MKKGSSAVSRSATTGSSLSAASRWGLSLSMPEIVPSGAATEVDAHSIALSYNPLIDTENLRSNPNDFESLRNHYNLRNEVGC